MYQGQDKTSKRCIREIGAHTYPIQAGVLNPINDADSHRQESDKKSLHVLRRVLEFARCPEYRDIKRY